MYLTIDLGGTKTLLATFSPNGKKLRTFRFPTPIERDEFLSMLVKVIRANFTLDGLTAIAMAIPGPVKDEQPVFFGNLDWKTYDFKSFLSEKFGVPVTISNDASASLVAETRKLTRGKSIFITYSTGIGGAIGADGKPSNKYFEPGHVKFVYNKKPTEYEDIASARAVSIAYGNTPVSEITNPEAWGQIAERIALGLSPIIANEKPNRIIFGGPLGEQLPWYKSPLKHLLRSTVPISVKLPKLIRARYKSESVIYGLYFLLAQQYRKK
jgi:predicted NBD/HSP70 family sugar kinase